MTGTMANSKSYLIEITADIFTHSDPETGRAIVDLILDEAQQKGTGKVGFAERARPGRPHPNH